MVKIILQFTYALLYHYSFSGITQYQDTELLFLGSDLFIIVNKINESYALRWFEQTYLSQFGLQGVILSINTQLIN